MLRTSVFRVWCGWLLVVAFCEPLSAQKALQVHMKTLTKMYAALIQVPQNDEKSALTDFVIEHTMSSEMTVDDLLHALGGHLVELQLLRKDLENTGEKDPVHRELPVQAKTLHAQLHNYLLLGGGLLAYLNLSVACAQAATIIRFVTAVQDTDEVVWFANRCSLDELCQVLKNLTDCHVAFLKEILQFRDITREGWEHLDDETVSTWCMSLQKSLVSMVEVKKKLTNK
jgi:hypothetical protein